MIAGATAIKRNAITSVRVIVQQFGQIIDAIEIPVRVILRVIALPHKHLTILIIPAEPCIGGEGIRAIVELFTVEPPVSIRVVGRIRAVVWIKAIGLLPDICHAVEVGIVFVTIVCVG
jgi:hypothetical protein